MKYSSAVSLTWNLSGNITLLSMKRVEGENWISCLFCRPETHVMKTVICQFWDFSFKWQAFNKNVFRGHCRATAPQKIAALAFWQKGMVLLQEERINHKWWITYHFVATEISYSTEIHAADDRCIFSSVLAMTYMGIIQVMEALVTKQRWGVLNQQFIGCNQRNHTEELVHFNQQYPGKKAL